MPGKKNKETNITRDAYHLHKKLGWKSYSCTIFFVRLLVRFHVRYFVQFHGRFNALFLVQFLVRFHVQVFVGFFVRFFFYRFHAQFLVGFFTDLMSDFLSDLMSHLLSDCLSDFVFKNLYNRLYHLHTLAANGCPAMKCWKWQQNDQFPHSSCNFVIRMDYSIDDKNMRQKFFQVGKSSGTLLGRFTLKTCLQVINIIGVLTGK